jgi:outer membrane protein TolC
LQTQVLKKQKELLVVNIDKLTKLLKIVEAQFTNGFAKKIDVDRLKVTETNLRTDLQNVQLSEEQLLALLKFQMTMPMDTPILLTDTLDNQSILKGAITPQEPIDIKLLAQARDLNNIQNEVVKSGYYPNVAAFGSFQTQAQRNDFDFYKSDKPWFKTTVFGLQLNVPIFDGFQKSAKMQQNTIKNMQLKLDEENVRNAVSFQQRVAQNKVQTNLNNLETQKRNVALADDIYKVTQEQYKAGVASLSDILNAETAMKESQANYLRVMVELKLAELEVLKASGNIMSLVN